MSFTRRLLYPATLGLISLLTPPPTASAEGSVEDETLSDIEAALALDSDANADRDRSNASTSSIAGAARSMNPDLSLIVDVAVAAFSDASPLQTGAHDPSRNGFNLQQLELSAGSVIDPYFRFDANLVFEADGVEIEEAYGTTLDLPWRLQARFGQFLTRFGRLNASHPHTWAFVDQPFALGRVFGGEGNRGLGAELSYLTPLPWYVELVASGTDARGEGTARSFLRDSEAEVNSPADLLLVTAIKQFFPLSDAWSLLLGVSGAFGPDADGDAFGSQVYGSDLYVKFRPLRGASATVVSVQSEWYYRRRQLNESTLTDLSGYTQLLYRFSPRWAVAGRHEYGSPTTNTAGAIVADALDPEWTDNRHRLSLNITLWPTEFSRLRLQGARDLPGWQAGSWSGMLAIELVSGAHGSHSF